MKPEAPPPCPICGKPPVPAHRPFCSRRCRDIDLGRWFSGAYAVPAVALLDETDGEDDASGERRKNDSAEQWRDRIPDPKPAIGRQGSPLEGEE